MKLFEVDKVTSRKTIERLLEEFGVISKGQLAPWTKHNLCSQTFCLFNTLSILTDGEADNICKLVQLFKAQMWAMG